MASITITLPPHIKDYIERQVAEGRFDDEAAVIVTAVEQSMESGYRWEEDTRLLEAIAQADRGEGIRITDMQAYFDRLSREASEAAARGDEVSDDIKY